jgi:hypothetical protein
MFCFVLLTSRLLLPEASLTWSQISSMCEYSFNTLFDIYTTMKMCRDPRYHISSSIIIACILISNGALLSISLNIINTSNSDDNDDTPINNSIQYSFKISRLREITDNYYFRLIFQICFADLPFLVIRIIILLETHRAFIIEIYYLIAKQVIIILCKLIVMTYNWSINYVRNENLKELNEINNLNIFEI